VVGRRKPGPKHATSSQSSLESTPSNIKSESNEWPDPPDIPICSTEDEAASIYSDSDDLIPHIPDISGRGTYIIRKGRRQRQRLASLDSEAPTNLPDALSHPMQLQQPQQQQHTSQRPDSLGDDHILRGLPSPVFPASMITPKSRHSIDLGLSSANKAGGLGGGVSLLKSSPSAPQKLPSSVLSPSSTFDALQALDTSSSNGGGGGAGASTNGGTTGNHLNGCGPGVSSASGSDNPLLRVSSLPTITPPLTSSATAEGLATPRRELAPPIEEDEEADSDTQRGVPLRKIEDNISALLRGDISVARVADIPPARRPLGFRLGVHKSESAKEMLLSQAGLGPLPPSPPSSSPEPQDSDEFPPLPPSPTEEPEGLHQMHGIRISSRNRSSNGTPNGGSISKHDQLLHGYREQDHPPAIPPHRGPSINTLKTRSMDAGFSKSYRNGSFGSSTSPHAPGTLPPDLPGCNSRRRVITGGYQKRTAQSPREERSLQTSCSLPETPIFARGCDIPRTPHRRAPEVPPHGSGSRTAPRTNSTTSSLGSSVVGISASTTIGSRQRSISQALANGEMLRLAGGPARGWYPKQRHPRPASTENLDRLHPQGSLRAWEAAGTGSRKPLTLPPNLTPKFFNKSPREALRRVTSLLIRKGTVGRFFLS
uniref:Uncharacterized protein n=1 Tax=Anopheles melas TaxID=34690 RepID=A0A182UEG9_9DIPT